MASEKDMDKLKQSIDTGMGDMYSSTYYTDPGVSKTLSYMRTRAHRSIDNLIGNNISNVGTTNISALLTKTKLGSMQNDEDVVQGINASLENESIMSSIMQTYTQNSWLRDIDREIEMILKYMPKLEDALTTRREHVLCSDNFTSTTLHIRSKSATGKDIGVANNIKDMKEKYKLDLILDKVYRQTDKLGECFVYVVPYRKAIKRLLSDNERFGLGPTSGFLGEASVSDPGPVNEAFTIGMDPTSGDTEVHAVDEGFFTDNVEPSKSNFIVEMDKSCVIKSALAGYKKANSILNEAANLAINETALKTEKDNEGKKADVTKNISIDDSIKKGSENFYKLDGLTQDGLKTPGYGDDKELQLKVPGCVVKILDHTMVKPLYIDDICIGYFYIECDRKFDLEKTTFSNTIGGIRPGGAYKDKNRDPFYQDTQETRLLKNLAMAISRKIDKTFVNANQDLTKEIYAILKYNSTMNAEGRISKMRITFIPPDDMVHCFFEQDDETHRGISSLRKALFPAKLYSCLYISNVISILTRGNDKRVYYVKQMVDTNISDTLMNAINQIQRSNFGVRQIESMNNVLGMLGRFNDLLIPKSPSGDAPIDVETIPGQNVEVKTDLMNALEEMAVQSTGVPYDYIQAHQATDYATRLTMTNTRFLQTIYNLQALVKKMFSTILTRIYNAEFDSNEEIEYVPNVPTYLMTMNTTQILTSANDISEAITNMYVSDNAKDADLIKPKLVAELKKKYTSLFFPADDMQALIDEVQMSVAKEKEDEKQEQ